MTRHTRGAGRLLLGMMIGSLVAVAAALVSQYRYDMQPCPWCVLQRLIYVAIAAVSLIGVVGRSSTARRWAARFAAALALCGITAALWQHFKAAASASCNLTFADRLLSALQLDTSLPSVFEPRASCADAAINLLGVPYDFWSLALFVVLGVAAITALRRA